MKRITSASAITSASVWCANGCLPIRSPDVHVAAACTTSAGHVKLVAASHHFGCSPHVSVSFHEQMYGLGSSCFRLTSSRSSWWFKKPIESASGRERSVFLYSGVWRFHSIFERIMLSAL